MRQAQGELVAFLTQDAVPADDLWLANLVAFMDAHPQVAGAFGHQVPHPGADPLEAFEVRGRFDSFRNQPAVFCAAPAGSPPEGDAQRVRRHYFSNVNSCIRRQAWERIAFPEIDFGEDQAWAALVQSAGMATGSRSMPSSATRTNTVPWNSSGAAMTRRGSCAGSSPATSCHRGGLQYGWRASMPRSSAITLPPFPPPREAMPGFGRTAAWASSLGRYAGTRLADREGSVHEWLSLAERHRRA